MATSRLPAHPALAPLVASCEEALPGRIRGYYLLGSHADGTSLPTSDLDLTVLLIETATNRDRAVVHEIASRWDGELDLEIEGEDALRGGVTPTFKHGSLLLYGEDVRTSLPLLPIEGWTRDRLHAAYYLAITVFGRPVPVPPSLDYPDPEDEFYGYARHPVRVAGGDVPSTPDLI